MSKLYVYGDSFAANYPESGLKASMGWSLQLGEKLGRLVYNQAVPGSSTEYSMKRFTDDVQKELFKPNDIIIFVTSTPGRFHFLFQCERPETAAQYWNKVDITDPRHSWYRRNKSHLEWTMVNMDIHMAAINHECYIHALKDFAEARPDCTVIVLANSDHHTGVPSRIPFGSSPSNFLRPDIFLQTVSENEFNGFKTYNEFVKYTIWDPRFNHLSTVNSNILVDMIIRAIETRKTDHFKYDAFESKIFGTIQTVDDYNRYVTNGYLHYRSSIENNLPKKTA